MANHIFDLPDEVLQLIGDAAPLEPTILRLVCRRFDAAFLDLFAKRLLDDVHCFVLDPQRLNRLDAITRQAHLLCKIKKVTITLSPHEGKWIDDYPSVPDEEQFGHLSDAQSEFAKLIEEDCYGQWLECPQLDLSVLADILSRLKTSACPHVALSLSNGEQPWNRRRISEARWPVIADSTLAMIFHTVLASDCVISKLDLSDTRFVDIRTSNEAQWLKTLNRLGHGLRAMHLRLQADDVKRAMRVMSQHVQHRGDISSACSPLIAIISAAKSLQSLHISAPYCAARKYDGLEQDRKYRQFAYFVNTILDPDACRFERLESLSLSGMECSPLVLLDLLERNQQTLRTIEFVGVCLHNPEADAWLNVIKAMHSQCLNLTHLSLKSLQEQTQLVVDAANEHLSYADLLAPEPSEAFFQENRYDSELRLINRDEVVRGLLGNIENGPPFIQC
ncbi:hypothetical protein CLAFUW4_06518 [Fulvia fulva]|nr:hypothetical protein CLAFUR4_06526 [Fulvia fulva]KAK4622630.1 hypothetical protein CLAFUR0_06522 [Fulvia fulva]WPV16456.1 hypothetical protein CLAFUW4_06518 [Fulvia fulva]WPV31771.1 hypothetical protein CLAFUW7_06517 [Fulvia fulva]